MSHPIPVLLYHAVSDDPPPAHRRWAVRPATLRSHLKRLAEAGAVGLSVHELTQHLSDGTPVPPRSVVVTFDDGLADQLEAAVICAEAGFPPTVYVTAGFVGRPGYLDRAGLAELASLPTAEVGGHSMGHPHLDLVPRRRMQLEIDDCREHLHDLIQRDVVDFAFPHGSHSRRERDHLASTGWRSGAAVKNALTHRADDRFSFARVTVTERTGHGALVDLVGGEGAPLAWDSERIRTRAFREIRRVRHHLTGRR